MKRAFQFALGLTLIATAASTAHAQHRRNVGGVSTSTNVQQLIQGYPAPGLGFDFTHHAAVNRHLATRALIDPVTQHQLALAREIRREAPAAVGIPVLVGGGTTVIIVQQPPPTIVVQGAGGNSTGDEDELEQRIARLERASYSNRLERLERLEREESARGESAEPSAERDREPASEPQPKRNPARPARPPRTEVNDAAPRQSSEIIFIRRDGSIIFAVAFTKQRERIVYISSEGQRRTLALADLDLDATVQMNEARGAEIRF